MARHSHKGEGLISEAQRAALAREILELTHADGQRDNEITARDYRLAARQAGVILTDRQARVVLEKAVAAGQMARREVKASRRVFYRLIVGENQAGQNAVGEDDDDMELG